MGYSKATFVTLEADGTGTVLKMLAESINLTTYLGRLQIKNARVTFDNIGAFFSGGFGSIEWVGGALVAASGVTKLIGPGNSQACNITIRDVDLSASGRGATAAALVWIAGARNSQVNILFERCKISADAGFLKVYYGAGITGLLGSIRFHHCSASNKTYEFDEDGQFGSIVNENTIVRTGGASDGTTVQAYKMVSASTMADNYVPLISPPVYGWTDSTAPTTFTIEVLHDSATALQDDEVWMEFEYPANNTDGLGAVASSKCTILAAPADIPDSAAVWETGAMANPNTRKLTVTVTPGKVGPITARVCLAKASTIVYIDPVITEG
ncbi:MAG: hypothetical protein Q8M94_01515 [Ignavibacteria bacterium]|nr:hypothetical protein [Ignavibacteria bacterium]